MASTPSTPHALGYAVCVRPEIKRRDSTVRLRRFINNPNGNPRRIGAGHAANTNGDVTRSERRLAPAFETDVDVCRRLGHNAKTPRRKQKVLSHYNARKANTRSHDVLHRVQGEFFDALVPFSISWRGGRSYFRLRVKRLSVLPTIFVFGLFFFFFFLPRVALSEQRLVVND